MRLIQTFLLAILCSGIAYGADLQCNERFNTHYGYVHKIKTLKNPKQDACFNGLQFKIVLDRVAIIPILGPDWGQIEERETIYGSDQWTVFMACNYNKCWYVTRAEFETLTGKVAVSLDGTGTRMRAIGLQILIEE